MAHRRHLMIGSGPASVAAAEEIRKADGDAEITILGAEALGYYSRPGLAYYLAKEVPERSLFPYSPEDFASLDIGLLRGRAVQVDAASQRVLLDSGRALPYDRLLIATGSAAIPAGVPGSDLDGVTKLDDMGDARDLIRRARDAKAAVVVGGGITALEIVEGLRTRKVHVHYLERKERYWSNVLSETESSIVEKALASRGVEIHHFTELAQILGKNGRVVAVQTSDGAVIPCDIVAIAIGVLPQKALAEEAGLECGRGVMVDEYLRSSTGNVFAAGDLAEVADPATGRRTLEVLWNSAVVKGRIAGLNMAGEPTRRYESSVPLNVTRLAGSKVTIMGTVGTGKDTDLKSVARGDSETWREHGATSTVEWDGPEAHVRLSLGERTIAGAVVMGDQSLSFPLQEIIAARADVSPIMADLRSMSTGVAELIYDFWRSWTAQLVW